MHIVMFYHSLVSDWNHGNAHFLRGVVTELLLRGHRVDVYEPAEGWSLTNLTAEWGDGPLHDFARTFPHLQSIPYHLETLDLNAALEGADLVIAHEWNDLALIHRLGEHRRTVGGYRLLFHDTHHRSVSEPHTIAGCRLLDYDGVLAFGQVIRDRYLEQKWAQDAWTWHEAADVSIFRPPHPADDGGVYEGDLVWVGNWGDDERMAQLHEFLIQPVKEIGLRASLYGVRYPADALEALKAAGICYRGWLPNHHVPATFAQHRFTVHVPRQFYVTMLPGIPTIRVFEALACGIPLICAPWDDAEGLFTPGRDYLVARNGAEMQRLMRLLLNEPAARQALAQQGLQTIRARHTCGHRVDELLEICRELGVDTTPEPVLGIPSAAPRHTESRVML